MSIPTGGGSWYPDDLAGGLFGPHSVTWRVATPPVVAVGGLRALMLQALHPTAVAALTAHTGFHGHPWQRLGNSTQYLATVTYGSLEQIEVLGEQVRRLHHQIRGFDPALGVRYRADDPQLLLWVHCTLAASLADTARRSGIPLSHMDLDRFYAEQVAAAEVIGLPTELVPASAAAIDRYFARLRPSLRLTRPGWQAVRFLVTVPMPRRVELLTPARPAWTALCGLSFALLPRWARRLYHLPGLPTTDLAATMTLRALRHTTTVLPRSLREGPHQRAARLRLAASDATP